MNGIILDQYEELAQLNIRTHGENKSSETRERNPYQRDYSRILYSSSFRRLQGKMQLMGIDSIKFYRNRLTHSLEVSQIARAIAERLRPVLGNNAYNEDMYVIEACSIAHDIGNPPFGHHGELILNKLAYDFGGFEGNAQTLRILNTLEKKLPEERGLNLTLRTQLGVVKYFNSSESLKKKFIYKEDYNKILNIVDQYGIHPRTLDAQIMDLADEIAYAAHDLEDSLALKLFTLDEFLYDFNHYIDQEKEKNQNKSESLNYAINKFRDLVENARNVAFKSKNIHSSEEYAQILRKELISNLVNELIIDISVQPVTQSFIHKTGTLNEYELKFEKLEELAQGLKKFTFKCINRQNKVLLYEKVGEKVIKGLFDVFTDESFNKNNLLLPAEYRIETGELRERCVVDYIAGMMDTFAIQTYEKYFGSSELEKLYP